MDWNSGSPEEQEVLITLRPPLQSHLLFWGGRDNRTHWSGAPESFQGGVLQAAAQMEGAHLLMGSALVVFDVSGPAHQMTTLAHQIVSAQ